eukprot:8665145-Pyramimonas_sp.AAC.1
MDHDFAAIALQAMVYQAIYDEGTKWAPPDSRAGQPATAGQPAASSGAAERCYIYTSSSASPISPGGSAACKPGAGPSQVAAWTPPSLKVSDGGERATAARACPNRATPE